MGPDVWVVRLSDYRQWVVHIGATAKCFSPDLLVNFII